MLSQARGRVLARDAVSDVDLPPFEKAAMDGFAVRAADFHGAAGPVRLAVVGESKAGAGHAGGVQPGQCVEIYTGAELPADCDAVVMVEKSLREGAAVVLDDAPAPGQHVCHRGEDLAVGDLAVPAGRRLRPVDLAVLAAVGADPVLVRPRVRLGLATTGDELVPPSRRPGPGQIREGNTFDLAARAEAAGAEVVNLGILPDDPAVLAGRFEELLSTCDALITTGGVSMGRYDLVGATFERCGVTPILHKIAIKPGKPLWFGVRGRVPVFGLPGNPVSCLVGFEVFVRPALYKMEGADPATWDPPLRRGRWAGAEPKPNPRQQHLPVVVEHGADGVDLLRPLAWSSSADIVELSRAQGLAVIEPEARLTAGALVPYRPL
ncbi:MAG: molybdopterin molybdotransferase MoeA [Planctomycetes bacterium]|nr:molybdopterin molybdotransferase MoeA [Planctomycetota bacterium]